MKHLTGTPLVNEVHFSTFTVAWVTGVSHRAFILCSNKYWAAQWNHGTVLIFQRACEKHMQGCYCRFLMVPKSRLRCGSFYIVPVHFRDAPKKRKCGSPVDDDTQWLEPRKSLLQWTAWSLSLAVHCGRDSPRVPEQILTERKQVLL